MATRIPDLPTLTGDGSMAADLLVIYDADLNVTKSISRSELAAGIAVDLPEIPTVGTLGLQDYDSVHITGGDMDNVTITGGTISGLDTPLAVVDGGTGADTAAGARSNLGAAARGANSDITSLSGLTTPLSVPQGGTGTTTLAGLRTAIGAAASGSNSDITSLHGLTTPLSIAQGGTGSTTAAAALVALGGIRVDASSFTENGYIKFGGLIIQWGKYLPGGNVGQGIVSITFPVVFPTAVFNISLTSIGADGNDDCWPQVDSSVPVTTAGFSARTQAETSGKNHRGYYWLAIGN